MKSLACLTLLNAFYLRQELRQIRQCYTLCEAVNCLFHRENSTDIRDLLKQNCKGQLCKISLSQTRDSVTC